MFGGWYTPRRDRLDCSILTKIDRKWWKYFWAFASPKVGPTYREPIILLQDIWILRDDIPKEWTKFLPYSFEELISLYENLTKIRMKSFWNDLHERMGLEIVTV